MRFSSLEMVANNPLRSFMPWNTVAKRIAELIRKDRYFTPQEHAKYEELQHIKAETDPMPNIEYDVYKDYTAVKDAHADDIVLYQVGNFFEMYGEDARAAAAILDISLTTRIVNLVERVPMCGIPSNQLEQYTEKLHDAGRDVVISGIEQQSDQRRVFRLDVPKAPEPIVEIAPVAVPTPHDSITQEDIDTALRAWNGDAASKLRVAKYMTDHAREKDTAAWLSNEYGSTVSNPLHITVTGTALETELPWTKVQRRLAQLINENSFLSEQETLSLRYQVVVYHHFENGFDEKLDYRTMQEAEKAAQGYVDGTLEADGFAYDGAAIYDLQEKQYLRVFGDYPDDAAIVATQPVQEAIPIEIAAELDLTDADLQDVLTGNGGLLDYLDKDKIGGWFRAGDDNAAIAQKLGDAYAGTAEAMTLLSGETADYFASANGLAINIHDKFNTNLSFGWNEIAPVLRAMYEQERDGFSHEMTTQHPEPEQPVFPYVVGDTVCLEDGKAFIITEVTDTSVQLQDPTLFYPIFRAESRESFARLMERYPQPELEQQQSVTKIQQELDGRGFVASSNLVEEGLKDYHSRGGRGDFQDAADYIENEYLTEEKIRNGMARAITSGSEIRRSPPIGICCAPPLTALWRKSPPTSMHF